MDRIAYTKQIIRNTPGGRALIFRLLGQLAANFVPKLQQFVLHRHGLGDQRLHVLVGQQVSLLLEPLLPQTLLDFRNEEGVFLDLK